MVSNTNGSGAGSFRQAILDANNATTEPHNIDFAANITGTINLSSSLSMFRDININAPALPITISGDGSFRIFDILGSTTVNISGLNVTGGRAAAGSMGGRGGAFQVGSGSTLSLFDLAIFNNSVSASGGAIANLGGTVNITNCTLNGNSTFTILSTGNDGGAIRNENNGTVNINNSTISMNSAQDDGGGISNAGGSTVNLSNTILEGNTNGDGSTPDCSGTLSSQDFNLIQDTTGCTVTGTTTNNITGTGANLGPLQNNGGNTLTKALLEGSPALDTGNPATPDGVAPNCETTDQRGITRPQGLACDIGAYEDEVIPPPVVSEADLIIFKVPSVAIANNGDQGIFFTITVTNEGPDPATDVHVSDDLTGAGNFNVTDIQTDQGTCSAPSAVSLAIECSLGQINMGQTVTIKIIGDVTGLGEIFNIVGVVDLGGTTDPDFSNNFSGGSIIVVDAGQIDLTGGSCSLSESKNYSTSVGIYLFLGMISILVLYRLVKQSD